LPRDAMHKSGQCRCAVSVYLSCCLSRSCIVSKRVIVSSNFLLTSGSHTILVFSVPNLMAIFQRGPHNGASNAGGTKKIAIFDQQANLALSQK